MAPASAVCGELGLRSLERETGFWPGRESNAMGVAHVPSGNRVSGRSGSSNRRGVAQAAWKKRGFGRAGADRKAGWHVESAVVGVATKAKDGRH